MNNEHQQVLFRCTNLAQYFDDADQRIDIFQQLNFTINNGETVAITGASGSGKSTLLYLLGGLEHAKNGSVEVAGQDIGLLSDNKMASFRNKNFGFVYQFHHLLAEFSALENVCMPLLIRGDKTTDAINAATQILEQVGLSHRLTHKPSEMSGGERQRTAIARALVTQPLCVLADEPTGNLDNKTAGQVYDLLLSLNQSLRTSLVVVTHDQMLADKMSRKFVLSEGKLQEL